jgi:NAD dependent epimerase/dehydratase family enzyme
MAEETILTSQRVLPARLEKAGYKFAFPELTGALTDVFSNKS